jgi:UDP-N-acetylglucosamine 2-epimerase (non-hydrolysing)
VLVQGDTTTVMAAALLAFYHQIRVGHVEAGLRSFDKWQPFPEEINRRVASVAADLHFAPTEWARDNLVREGVPSNQVIVTGNPVIDALRQVASLPAPVETLRLFERLGLPADSQVASASTRRIVLITAHRRENFGAPFERICQAIASLAAHYGEGVQFVYPVHLNPNVQGPVYRLLSGIANITLLAPLDYLPLVQVMKRAALVLTDSGGLQEEAPGLGVPVLVLREVTERPEGVRAGTVRLVGTDPERIIAETRRLLDDPVAHAAMAQAVNPYGDGYAAERIVRALLEAQSV